MRRRKASGSSVPAIQVRRPRKGSESPVPRPRTSTACNCVTAQITHQAIAVPSPTGGIGWSREVEASPRNYRAILGFGLLPFG
jgi:hypothetical protein